MSGIKYQIRRGDTLSKIAKELYGDASKWRSIYAHNNKAEVKRKLKRQITNPDVLRVGEYLFLPGTSIDFKRGSTIVGRGPEGAQQVKPAKKPEEKQLSTLWLGVGEAHSGDLVIAGYFNWNARLYRLGASEGDELEWANLVSHGYKLGGGLGGSGGAVAVFAHGIARPSQFTTAFSWGDMDFDLAIGGQLKALLKGLKGIGKVLETMEQYKKLNYAGQELLKNKAFFKKGVYTIPIPLAGAGVHVWIGRKYARTVLQSTGTGAL